MSASRSKVARKPRARKSPLSSTPTPVVPRAKTSRATKDGQAAGAWLAERAPYVLLVEFSSRPHAANESEPSRRLQEAVNRLQSAIGPMMQDEAVAAAFHALDAAIWDVAIEHEDRAWHAAWQAAINMGRR